MKSIAEKLGVSVSTVSRVLSGKAERYRISKKTAARVRVEAEKTGFAPNQIASALRLKQTHTIGLIIPDISNPFFAAIARNVEMEAAKRGYFIILCDSRDSTETEVEYIRLLQARSVDGLIISPVGKIGAHLRELRSNGVPVVLVDRYFPDLDIPFVTTDNMRGAYKAVSLLLNSGHLRIACIRGIHGSSTADDRVRGYQDALTDAGVALDRKLMAGDEFSETCGYRAAKILFSVKGPRPTAIFSQSNLITFGILKAFEELNISVPEDVSVVSFDDHYYAAFLATPLTTVAQDKERIGREAVKLLFKQLDDGVQSVKKGISIPARMVKRKSVKNVGCMFHMAVEPPGEGISRRPASGTMA